MPDIEDEFAFSWVTEFRSEREVEIVGITFQKFSVERRIVGIRNYSENECERYCFVSYPSACDCFTLRKWKIHRENG